MCLMLLPGCPGSLGVKLYQTPAAGWFCVAGDPLMLENYIMWGTAAETSDLNSTVAINLLTFSLIDAGLHTENKALAKPQVLLLPAKSELMC